MALKEELLERSRRSSTEPVPDFGKGHYLTMDDQTVTIGTQTFFKQKDNEEKIKSIMDQEMNRLNQEQKRKKPQGNSNIMFESFEREDGSKGFKAKKIQQPNAQPTNTQQPVTQQPNAQQPVAQTIPTQPTNAQQPVNSQQPPAPEKQKMPITDATIRLLASKDRDSAYKFAQENVWNNKDAYTPEEFNAFNKAYNDFGGRLKGLNKLTDEEIITNNLSVVNDPNVPKDVKEQAIAEAMQTEEGMNGLATFVETSIASVGKGLSDFFSYLFNDVDWGKLLITSAKAFIEAGTLTGQAGIGGDANPFATLGKEKQRAEDRAKWEVEQGLKRDKAVWQKENWWNKSYQAVIDTATKNANNFLYDLIPLGLKGDIQAEQRKKNYEAQNVSVIAIPTPDGKSQILIAREFNNIKQQNEMEKIIEKGLIAKDIANINAGAKEQVAWIISNGVNKKLSFDDLEKTLAKIPAEYHGPFLKALSSGNYALAITYLPNSLGNKFNVPQTKNNNPVDNFLNQTVARYDGNGNLVETIGTVAVADAKRNLSSHKNVINQASGDYSKILGKEGVVLTFQEGATPPTKIDIKDTQYQSALQDQYIKFRNKDTGGLPTQITVKENK